LIPHLDPFARPDQDPPDLLLRGGVAWDPGLLWLEQQNLYPRPKSVLSWQDLGSPQPGRDDLGVVENQQIPALQVVGEVAEAAVLVPIGVHHQHSRLIPWLHRPLRDPLRR